MTACRPLLHVLVARREFFLPNRTVNPTKIYVGAGMGRTGTTTLHLQLQEMGVKSAHASPPAIHLPQLAYMSPAPYSDRLNDFAAIFPTDSPAMGLLDVPVGEFVMDLLDAFPNHNVVLTVRGVRGARWGVPCHDCR